MDYEVISRFYDRDRGLYIDPGAPCPPLDEATAARLVRAGCLVAVEAPSPEPKLPRAKNQRKKQTPPEPPADGGE